MNYIHIDINKAKRVIYDYALLYITIAYCILIKIHWTIKLSLQQLFNKSISTYTGSSIKDMFNSNRNFIFRADGEIQQVRGFIHDLNWVCYEGTASYETRMKRLASMRIQTDIIDYRKE